MNFYISIEDILHHNISTVVQKAKRCLMQDIKKQKLTSTLSEIWFIPLDLKTTGSLKVPYVEMEIKHSPNIVLEINWKGGKNSISKEGCKQRATYCCSLGL